VPPIQLCIRDNALHSLYINSRKITIDISEQMNGDSNKTDCDDANY